MLPLIAAAYVNRLGIRRTSLQIPLKRIWRIPWKIRELLNPECKQHQKPRGSKFQNVYLLILLFLLSVKLKLFPLTLSRDLKIVTGMIQIFQVVLANYEPDSFSFSGFCSCSNYNYCQNRVAYLVISLFSVVHSFAGKKKRMNVLKISLIFSINANSHG